MEIFKTRIDSARANCEARILRSLYEFLKSDTGGVVALVGTFNLNEHWSDCYLAGLRDQLNLLVEGQAEAWLRLFAYLGTWEDLSAPFSGCSSPPRDHAEALDFFLELAPAKFRAPRPKRARLAAAQALYWLCTYLGNPNNHQAYNDAYAMLQACEQAGSRGFTACNGFADFMAYLTRTDEDQNMPAQDACWEELVQYVRAHADDEAVLAAFGALEAQGVIDDFNQLRDVF